ncbi:MAG: alpha-L-fucosidase [Clostridia bacterium]|nr:alpha-L-fucosidase [Clostridia bacterium]
MSIPVPEPRIRAFESFGFGMFVHWGLYSQLGRGEWVRHFERIPPETYDELLKTFTASRFDADALARLARDAGCRYITLTARHHEGFSLYDTKGLSAFDAPHSPAGRDLISEFVDACRRHGIAPFFYHTTLDWRHPDFEGDFRSYLKYLRASVEILCTAYGPIGGIWFDGNWSKPEGTDWEEDELYALIRRYQPEAMIINNTGIASRGKVGHPEIDSTTFEQGRPEPMDREGMDKYVAAEMCETLNDHWGIGTKDFNYKSLARLIENLCACRKVGANYLLNVGPDGEGSILPLQAELMRGIGAWIRAVGEDPVYLGRPCGVSGEEGTKDFALKEAGGDRIWFFIHDLPVAGTEPVKRTFLGLKDTIRDLHWTDNGESLPLTQSGGSAELALSPYPYGTSLVVRIAEGRV